MYIGAGDHKIIMSIKINGATSNANAEVDAISKALRVTLYDVNGVAIGPRATYDAASSAFTPGATPTDVFTLTGSGTKTIRVTRIRVSGIQTTTGNNAFFLIKRSSANTGGTSASVTAVPRDSTNAAATGTVLQYTANPTLGGTIGSVRCSRLFTPAAAAVAASDTIIWDFDDFQTGPVILRGTGQVLAVNFNGAALPAGLSLLCSITWTEE